MHPQAAPQLRPRTATLLLASSMFLTGASGFVFECILSTVATFIVGNSVEQFSVTISLMMLMMGFAGFWQRRISDRNLVEKFLAVEAGMALLGGFAPIAVYAAYATMEVHYIAVQYFFILSIGFLIGLEIPLVLRLNRNFVPELKSNIASVFSTDYVGAFIGALVWVYVLLRYFPLTEISFFVAGANFAVALATYAYFSYHRVASRGILPLAAIVLVAAVVTAGYARNREWNEILEQRFYSAPVAFSKTTSYQHIVLTASSDPTDYRLFINGNLQFSSRDEAIYHEMLVHPAMAMAQRNRRVLILGGGDGLALREVLKYDTVAEVTLVDIDPGMIDFARDHDIMAELNAGAFGDSRVLAGAMAGSPESPLRHPVFEHGVGLVPGGHEAPGAAAYVSVYTLDASRVLEHLEGLYDVIVVDLPDPSSIELVKLYSREFYLRLHRLLAPGSVMVLQATSPYHARESFLCILRTVQGAGYEVLPYHDNVPSFGDWGWIVAVRGDIPADSLSERALRLEHLAVRPDTLRYLTLERFRAALSFGKGGLDSAHDTVNTLMNPTLLAFYLDESWVR